MARPKIHPVTGMGYIQFRIPHHILSGHGTITQRLARLAKKIDKEVLELVGGPISGLICNTPGQGGINLNYQMFRTDTGDRFSCQSTRDTDVGFYLSVFKMKLGGDQPPADMFRIARAYKPPRIAWYVVCDMDGESIGSVDALSIVEAQAQANFHWSPQPVRVLNQEPTQRRL